LTEQKLTKALGIFGYTIERQTGSHIRLTTSKNGEHRWTQRSSLRRVSIL